MEALIGTVIDSGPLYLADTSALVRVRLPAVEETLRPLIEAGRVARCGPVDLEILRTARNAEQIAQLRHWLGLRFPLVPISQEDYNRAAEVTQLLAAANLHRAAKVPDLVIAAIAERSDLTVIHYDADFDHIASVTHQPVEWVAPRGSLPP